MMSSKTSSSASNQRNMAESTYANSDAINLFNKQQQQHSRNAQKPNVPTSSAGEYASLCIAMSSSEAPANNNAALSQARLRPAHYRLSDGFDYELANPEQISDCKANNNIPEQLSNAPITYGEYACTDIAADSFRPMITPDVVAGYSSGEEAVEDEHDEGDEMGPAFHASSSHQSRPQVRSLPVEPMTIATITDENRPNSFAAAQQAFSTFSNSNSLPNTNRTRTKSGGVEQLPANSTKASCEIANANTTSSSASLATAGSGLQALKVRRQMIEAALSGASAPVASPVVPAMPPLHVNNNSNGTTESSSASSQSQQTRKADVGHLDMSQYSNLESKVHARVSTSSNPTSTSTTTSYQSSSLKVESKSVDPPVSNRNKVLTSSSRKTSSKPSKKEPENDEMPALPITELSERLAREAKAIAGRRSMVLPSGAATTAMTASTTNASARPSTGSLQAPVSGPMSQSMHVAAPQSENSLLDASRHHGQIRWTKIIENGKRIKKAWTIYYCVFVMSPPRLFFFKDEKSAMKSAPLSAATPPKPQYDLSVPSSWSVCSQSDLPSKLQFTKRKNVLFVACPHGAHTAPVAAKGDGNAASSNGNVSPPLHTSGDSSILGFPDVALGFLIEGPNTEQTEIWMRHLLQSGSLTRYSSPANATSSPPSAPRGSTDSHHHHHSPEIASASATTSSSNGNIDEKALAKVSVARSRAVLTAANTGTKTSLMKLLTGFFKRRPTMEHLKKKGYIRELVFGSSLESIYKREKSEVPLFVISCVEEIEARGLDTDGLYRTSGNLAQVQKLRCMVDQGQSIHWDRCEIAVLTGTLKMFFRELREPLITTEVYDKLTEYATQLRQSLDPQGREAYLRKCLAMLPSVHFSTARFLFGHFVNVLKHSAQNRMELQSLAIVVAPNLMAPHTDVRSVATHALLQKYIAEDLIQFYYSVFFSPSDSGATAVVEYHRNSHGHHHHHIVPAASPTPGNVP